MIIKINPKELIVKMQVLSLRKKKIKKLIVKNKNLLF